jgi:Tfp pilus assembly ATPase PilU
MAGMYCMADLLNLLLREGAEELRLETGKPPEMVLRGQSRVLDQPPLTIDHVTELLKAVASPAQMKELENCGDVRFNHTAQHSERFGVAASLKRENMILRLRNLGK